MINCYRLNIRSHKERIVEPLNPAVTGLSSFNKCGSVELSSWKDSLNRTQMNGSRQVYSACHNHSDYVCFNNLSLLQKMWSEAVWPNNPIYLFSKCNFMFL